MLQSSVDIVNGISSLGCFYLNDTLRCLSTFLITGQSRNVWYLEILSYYNKVSCRDMYNHDQMDGVVYIARQLSVPKKAQ